MGLRSQTLRAARLLRGTFLSAGRAGRCGAGAGACARYPGPRRNGGRRHAQVSGEREKGGHHRLAVRGSLDEPAKVAAYAELPPHDGAYADAACNGDHDHDHDSITVRFIPGDPLSDPACETFHVMSGIFDGYERDYCELSTATQRKLSVLASLSPAEKHPKAQEIEADLSEAEALVRRMDLEARSLPVGVKTPLLAKLKEYKSDLAKLKRELRAAGAMEEESMRDELLSRAELGGSSSSGAQREQLLSATDRVRATGDRIKQGKQVLLETEELGVSILQDLHKQRETIIHARENLHEADDNVGRARRVLTTMSRRAVTNKLIMVAIILLLLGSIGLVVYFKFINK